MKYTLTDKFEDPLTELVFASIQEKSTGLVIKDFIPVNRAQEICCNLNSGGGFNGFTPEFFGE